MATLTDMVSKLVSANAASSSGSGPKTPSLSKQETKVTKDQVQTPSSQNTAPIQPSVIQPKSQALVSEPVVALVSALMTNLKPSIPYPSRRDNEKCRDQANEQIKKFYEIFKEMNFEISFTDALTLMPKFASTLKALIENKEKLSEMARTTMNEHCSAVLLNKLPRKLGDPGKFLIPCEFPGMDECLALADLDASINLMPLSVWEGSHSLNLPQLTSRALIDVHKGELIVRIGNEAITYNLDQTVRYSANYNQMTANKIDVVEEYSQKGDILLLEAILNSEPSHPLPNQDQNLPSFKEKLKAYEAKTVKSSIEEPPKVELKDLPHHLEYAFLEGDNKLPVIIAKELRSEEKAAMARTTMNEHCSAVILNKLPRKLGDPEKFLIPCEFSGMDECLALADLGASINLVPLSVWDGLSLPELTPTCMTLELADHSVSKPIGIAKDVSFKVGVFHFPADFVVVDFELDPRVPLILGRCFLKTSRALIDVHKGELTLPCEEYSQEVLGFLNVTTSGTPTPHNDPIVSTTSPSLTPFGDSDFLLFEEADAFLCLEDDPDSSKINLFYYDPEGDIILLEAILNSKPSPQLPNQEQNLPLFKEELKAYEAQTVKSSVDEPPEVELKDLPHHLEYAFLEGDNKLPVIIAKELGSEEKSALIKVLKSHKRVIAWKLSDIQARLVTRWWVCIDYRKLNEATRKDHFPFPFMDQMLERLARNEYYCFLDSFSGYFQIPIDPRDQEKTTFTCPYGTFAYRRMPFGLCNAPGTFQRCMLAIFHDMVEKTREVFMDDFSVFGNSFENCLSRLDKMFQRCEDTNLSLNWEKSHFMVKEGIVLGHKISKNVIEVDRAKVDVIAKLPYPTIVKGIRSFLGYPGFYRRFIQDFSKIS
nr:reverse transcriptase domain-containing protein [Tanacetum cinerariifolium]